MEIGQRIKEMRENKHISQAKLAEEIGVSSGNVGDWERGRAKPGADALICLMEYFGTSSDWLLTGKCAMTKESVLSDQDLSDMEAELLKIFRELDVRDKKETIAYVTMKRDLALKNLHPPLSTTKNGGNGTGEEAATSEIA